MSGRRRAVLLAFTVAAVATVTQAKAEDRSTGASSATFSSLPSGIVPQPPKAKAPGAIPASEKVPGFFVAGHKGRKDYVSIVSTAKLAKQLSDGTRDDSSLGGEACFTEDQPRNLRGDDGENERAWRNDLQPMLTMSASGQRGQPRPAVTAVHSERVAEQGGRATLEVIDAWVDPVTRGVRLIARSSVPLELVSTLLGGTKLYAARESQSVHVVLVTPKAPRSSGQSGIFAIVDNSVVSSSCDHIRATLKTEKGQGETASFISNVELPSPEPKDPPEQPGARIEVRTRPVHVNASVTWPTREKAPLLTVSAGWDSRER